jgi:hypothetical protein
MVTRNGKTTHDLAYGTTGLPTTHLAADALLALIRHHWHIENRCHWRLDVTLGEDACRVTLGKTPQVLTTLNNTVLALVDRLRLPNLAARCVSLMLVLPALLPYSFHPSDFEMPCPPKITPLSNYVFYGLLNVCFFDFS